MLYLHPYELAAGETAEFSRAGVTFSRRRALTQELWRSRVAGRLRGLFTRHAFGTIIETLELPWCDEEPGSAVEAGAVLEPAGV